MGAARLATNLSELELTLGQVARAELDAARSVIYADRSADLFERLSRRTSHADALHQAGRQIEAEMLFREAEQMQKKQQPACTLLYSLRGFRYCDLLLAAAERSAWKVLLGGGGRSGEGREAAARLGACGDSCRNVAMRTEQTLSWERKMTGAPLLDFALIHLTLGRAALYAAILETRNILLGRHAVMQSAELTEDQFAAGRREVQKAVDFLRRSGQVQELPRGLLTRAWQCFIDRAASGPAAAQADLDEAWEIAERGPMPLFLADIHLTRARLFGRLPRNTQSITTPSDYSGYPWNQNRDGSPRSSADDLAEARRLIEKHGYWRRKEELEDAEAAFGIENQDER